MKRVYLIAVLTGLAAGAASGGVTTYSDTFSDGVRNKALWSVDNYFEGKFVETGGRLYGTSGVLNPLKDYHAITWLQKPAIHLVSQDILETEAVFRLPLFPIGSASDAYVSMELGLTIPNSIPEQSVFVLLRRLQSGRHLNLNVFKPDLTSVGWGLAMPGDGAKYYFKMRYNTASGMLSLWCKTAPEQSWDKLKVIDLNKEWNLWPGSSVNLQAYLVFATYKTRVDETKAVSFDNFKITHIRP